MKNKIIYSFLLTGIIMASCSKESLNPIPTTSISNASAFATKDRVENQVRGLYGALRSGQFYGGRYVVYNDIRGEEFLNELTNGVTGLEVWNLTANNNNAQVTGLWSQAYYVINLVNVFLDGMNTTGTAVVGDALSKNYTAEARLLRALSYYSLLQLYARPYYDGNGSKPGVPLRLTANTGAGNYDLERASVAQVYSQVLDDLNYAETNLPATYGVAATNTVRAHKNTAIALKTRVYLSMQKYAEVITEANKIVSAAAPFKATTGVPHALEADITNVFKSYTTNESIFSMPFNANETPGTQNQVGYYFGKTTGNGEYSLNPSGILGDANWKATDKRRTFITVSGGKSYLNNKYGAGSPYTDYVPVIRYAEVLLNLAEALARTNAGVDARAVALLNAVRQRSDNTTTFAPASQAELIGLILTERRIEFLGEGLRSPDLLRLGLTIPAKGSVAAVPSSAPQYIWPISATELILNRLMTDN
ncbi:MAG TPA: RagB/SusD family nutrient uptake outer membrane protein [Flavisolibacter sp.]|nr:RagB/SusD family nutrient uptake outer membrane protein [Flavisolibacter sp.]